MAERARPRDTAVGAGQGVTADAAGHVTWVVLSPHLDDAVISAWHVLSAPEDVRVVTVFAGVPGPGFVTPLDRAGGAEESAAHMRQRRADDEEALRFAGRRGVQLDLLDVQYRAHRVPRLRAAVEADPDRWLLLTAAEEAIRMTEHDLRPHLAPLLDGEVLCAPAGVGGHPDHVDVARFAVSLGDQGRRVRLYADMPYLIRHGPPSWFTGRDNPRADGQVEQALAAVGAAGRLTRHVVHLPPEEVQRKLEACRRYRTEFEPANRQFGGALTDPAIMQFEMYWSVDGGQPIP